jgi:rod shape-determining protein MreC
MPLGTLDRTPPPFFKQGPSALSKLMVFSALAVFLMVADARFKVSQPLRAAVSVVLQPLQWLAMQPVQAARAASGYFVSLDSARAERDATQRQMVLQTQRASQVEQLALENARLRQLLTLRERNHADGRAAEVLYDAADPFTRKVVIDAGLAQGVSHGSPVVDELGVVGQVTRVHPLVSEVTLLSDRDQAIPVLNTRTGVRGVAYGDPSFPGGALELRFMPASADVQVGDLLTTSGVDGVYPPGLHVARIAKVERRADSAFSRIHCTPQALIHGTRHVLVLKPLSGQLPPPPTPETAGPGQKGHRK